MKRNILLLIPAMMFLSGCVFSNSDTGEGSSNNSSKTYGFGDTVTVGDFEYKVNNASNTKHVGSEYLGADTDNNFVIVNLTVKNVGKSEQDLMGKMMTYHIGDSEYEPHSGGIYLDNGFYVLQSIGSGISKTIDVLYETPKEFSSSDYLLVKASSYSSKSAKIYMK